MHLTLYFFGQASRAFRLCLYLSPDNAFFCFHTGVDSARTDHRLFPEQYVNIDYHISITKMRWNDFNSPRHLQ